MKRTCLPVVLLAFTVASIATCSILGPIDFDQDASMGTVSRLFVPRTIEGLNFHKAAEALTTEQCAGSSIWHRIIRQCTKTPKRMYIIPHSAVHHDGEKCGTGKSDSNSTEYMIIVAGEQLSDPRTAVINGLAPLYGILSSNARAINAFNVLRGLDPIHVGFEYTSDRYCGGKLRFAKNTIFFFLTPPAGGQDLNFGFAYLGVSEVGMVSVKEDESLCLYKQSRNLGPGQEPFSTPTPSPTPGRDANLPGNIFELSNPVDLPECFPVAPLTDDPAPSPLTTGQPVSSVSTAASPSDSPSASPSPSPSASPSFSSLSNPGPTKTPEVSPGASPSSSEGPATTPGSTPSGSAESPSASPSISATSTNDSNAVCFPSRAKVALSSGNVISISDVRIGDKVQTGPGVFSEVFLFTHHTDEVMSGFVQVKTRSNATLELSPGHYISCNGQMRPAKSLRTGDLLKLGNGQVDDIVFLQMVVLRGLHNPQTLDGSIVVNGIVASTYTEAVDPSTAVALLAPIKFLYFINMLTTRVALLFFEGSNFFVNLLPNGPAVW